MVVSRVIQLERFSSQPRDGKRLFVQSSLCEYGVVSASVESDEDTMISNIDMTARFDELAVQALGLKAFEPLQSLGKPSITSIGNDGQYNVPVDVEPDLAGQTVEMKEVDVGTDTELSYYL